MSNLITYIQQQEIKPISRNKEAIFEQLATEVEIRDLQELLGNQFYQDIKKGDSKYNDLINGCDFTYEDYLYSHKGLKYVLAYFIYAEYSVNSRYNDTFTGIVKARREETQDSAYGELKAIQKNNRKIAYVYWEDVKRYLEFKDFEYYKATNNKIFNPKITKI